MSRDIVNLTPDLLIGFGGHRECYQHPLHDDRCIKVIIRGDQTETKREQAYYAYLERTLTDWQAIPRFYGNEPTNLGEGAVFELIRNEDGSAARTLFDYLDNEQLQLTYQTEIKQALTTLYHYQLKHNVLTMALKPHNLLLKQRINGQLQCYLIDNLGYAENLPLARYFRTFGQIKIQRKWQQFTAVVAQDFGKSAAALMPIS